MSQIDKDELPGYPCLTERDGIKLVHGQVPALHFLDLREAHDSSTDLETKLPEWVRPPRRTKLR